MKTCFSPLSPYKTFSSFLKEKFGFPVYKISLDAAFNCPHRSQNRDRGGCTYCNPRSFAPRSANPSLPISEQIKSGMKFLKKRYNTEKFIAYFQTHTNTLASTETLRRIYRQALEFDDIIGISIGTRPDCLPEQTLDLIQEISQKTFVIMELGLESANDKTLKKINRAHSVKDFTTAINNLKKRSIHTCAHIILGLPDETIDDMLKTADYLSSLEVCGVKIHHFHVVKETEIEKNYQEGIVKTMTLEEYKLIIIKFLEHLAPEIIIHRLIGDCPDELLISPKWNLGKSQILKSINDEMKRLNSWQGKALMKD